MDRRKRTLSILLCGFVVFGIVRAAGAFYVDPKEKTFEDNRFGETVVKNRGGDAKVFHPEMEAHEWLLARMNPQPT